MSSAHEMFWGEIAPCEHLVQIYEEDDVFLDSLEGFVAGGLRAGDGVMVIATPAHLQALEDRLHAAGVNLTDAQRSDQYISLNAADTLDRFMVGNWPDETRFQQVVVELLSCARGPGRRVRVFGEMVALLWADGHNGATVRLEHLWQGLCQRESLSLLCAYPRSGFTQDAHESMRDICAAHSKIMA